ncbi:hypothetical protein [Pedobacter sp. WC2423]|uniref:hypothetical protein n=1 Tax=Pedobacter sp. WC2423 TaxID=3234142 RepID=UPI003465E139
MTTQDESAYIDKSAIYDAAIEPQYLIKESKFLLLSILTFGLYPVWWIYKTWVFFIQRERSDASPAIRVVFNFFFLLPLLNRIRQFARQKAYQGNSYPLVSFILILGTSFCSIFPPPFFLICILTCVFLLPAVKALNYAIQQSPEILSYEDEGFRTRQMVLVVIGSIFWVLIVIGLIGQAIN